MGGNGDDKEMGNDHEVGNDNEKRNDDEEEGVSKRRREEADAVRRKIRMSMRRRWMGGDEKNADADWEEIERR